MDSLVVMFLLLLLFVFCVFMYRAEASCYVEVTAMFHRDSFTRSLVPATIEAV